MSLALRPVPKSPTVLNPELLERIRSRAAGYDLDNAFFSEDLAELREAGYLAPRGLADVIRDQRLLAAHAPATALGLGMHLIWMGVARALSERGDHTLDWMLEDAAAGELFAFGNSEAGNDLVMTDSATRVERVDGGYAFTGTKIFTSLSPAWTRLGIFGKLDDGEGEPRLIHGFITRGTPGWRSLGDWDTLGMRATQSYTTVLEGVVVPDARVARVLPVSQGTDPFMFAIFANFLLVIGSVYAGIADRALELAVDAVQNRTSRRTGRSYAEDPDFRWRVADMALAVDALAPQLRTLAADVDGLVEHGPDWSRLLVGVKHRCTETARQVVDQAMRCAGGSGYRATTELTRLQRDVLAGIYHPSDTESVHAAVAANLLGPLE